MQDQQDNRSRETKLLKDKLSELAASLREERYKDFPRILREVNRLDYLNPNALHLEGLYALQAERDNEKAHRLVAQAAEILPESPSISHNLATIKINLGKFAEAERLLLYAVQIKPDYAEAFHTLASVRKFKTGDPIIERMEQLAVSKKFPPEQATFICFALAKAYDDIGRYEDAWNVLVQGNDLMEEKYDSQRFSTGLTKVQKTFTKELFQRKARFGHPSKAPIFIVGMPRSGTTLLEAILGENPLIQNAGELPAVPTLGRKTSRIYNQGDSSAGFPELVEKIPDDQLFRWGEAYLSFAQSRLNGWAEYFTDKLPDNSFNIGLANLLLPNAKFIHITRDPMDITLSIYFQRFTNLNYGFTIKSIVEHYRNYSQFMKHWHEVLPEDRLLSVTYEDLVDDKSGIYRMIHDTFDLQAPHADVAEKPEVRTVSTASRWQARQPIYKTSKQKWKRYEEQLMATEAAELVHDA